MDRMEQRRIVWITGGGTGIGRALALRLAAHGWTVAVSGRRDAALREVVDAAPPGTVHAFPLDVTDLPANRATVAAIESELGPIDLAVLNAGQFTPFRAKDFSVEPFDTTMRVNFMGVVHGIDAILPAMRGRGRGHIALMASLSGYRGLPLGGPYSATKAALINLAESLRFDFDRMGLRVTVINPGFVKTPLTEQNRFHMPFLIGVEDAARRIERGLESGRFEIAFPLRFVLLLKLFRMLPYRLYFPVMRMFSGR
ncbi:MAG: SDR family NAD(P)-dependent oxidoreductase [Xanthomonadaceae bacterium]|nr:SDR family NAD(P)-dependent oxidoreductase [Xanthomonadaceae bacterium]